MDANADPEKHRDERATYGFSEYDWWNFNSYLAWVILQALARFAERGNGYPMRGENHTYEQWINLIGVMEEGFVLVLREDEYPGIRELGVDDWKKANDVANRRIKIALDVFSEYFTSLWD